MRPLIALALVAIALAGCDRKALHEKNVAICSASGLDVTFKIDPIWGYPVDYRCVPKGATIISDK